MVVFARKNRGPARTADRVRHQAAIETHALLRYSVDIRRLKKLGVVGADRLVSVVIGENEQNVRARRIGSVGWGALGNIRKERESKHGKEKRGAFNRVHSQLFQTVGFVTGR